MSYFKSYKEQIKEREAYYRMTEEERREANRLQFVKTARSILGEQAVKMQAEMNITDVLSEAALAGKVEFGIKPKISVLLEVFDKYTTLWTPLTKGNSIVLPPQFALSLLMKSLLKCLDTIEQKYYPIIGALPWEDDFRNLDRVRAKDYLNAFCNTPMPKLGEAEISDTLRNFFLHCSFTKNRIITVGHIVDWALSKIVLERDID